MSAFNLKGGIFECCGQKPKGGNKDLIYAKKRKQNTGAAAKNKQKATPNSSAYAELDDLQAMEIYALKEKANQAKYMSALNMKLKEQCDKLHQQLSNVRSQLAEEQKMRRASSTSPQSASSSEYLPPASPISIKSSSSASTSDILAHLDNLMGLARNSTALMLLRRFRGRHRGFPKW